MDAIVDLFGEGKQLTFVQMSLRAMVIFFIAWILVRIAGRRSFGFKTPLDNVTVILLGAILSRAVTGVSPFMPVIGACLSIAVLHRIITWIAIRHKTTLHFFEGNKILLFENGHYHSDNMRRALVSREDILQALRININDENVDGIDKIYMERNGVISIVKISGDQFTARSANG